MFLNSPEQLGLVWISPDPLVIRYKYKLTFYICNEKSVKKITKGSFITFISKTVVFLS